MTNLLNLTITDAAIARMEALAGCGFLRLDVKSTGCSGYSYALSRAEAQLPGDDAIPAGTMVLLIDKKNSWMMIGMTIDYQETDFAQEFVFSNPNEKGRCGCGESFAI